MDLIPVFATISGPCSDGTVVATSKHTGERFSIRQNSAVLPVRHGLEEPVTLSAERLNFPLPVEGKGVVCYTGYPLPRQQQAYCWTTTKLWRNAERHYAVLYYKHSEAEPETLWDEPGILGLSVRYQTHYWDAGVIWRDGRSYAEIVEVRHPLARRPQDHTPSEDPRVMRRVLPPWMREASDASLHILQR